MNNRTPTPDEIEQAYSDMYKAANGFRPYLTAWRAMSETEKIKEFQRTERDAEDEYKREQEDEKFAVVKFEKMVKMNMGFGLSREQVVKGLHDSNNTNGDDEYLCYHFGLPYGYFRKAA